LPGAFCTVAEQISKGRKVGILIEGSTTGVTDKVVSFDAGFFKMYNDDVVEGLKAFYDRLFREARQSRKLTLRVSFGKLIT